MRSDRCEYDSAEPERSGDHELSQAVSHHEDDPPRRGNTKVAYRQAQPEHQREYEQHHGDDYDRGAMEHSVKRFDKPRRGRGRGRGYAPQPRERRRRVDSRQRAREDADRHHRRKKRRGGRPLDDDMEYQRDGPSQVGHEQTSRADGNERSDGRRGRHVERGRYHERGGRGAKFRHSGANVSGGVQYHNRPREETDHLATAREVFGKADAAAGENRNWQVIGCVGRTGCGKSTVMSNLVGAADVRQVRLTLPRAAGPHEVVEVLLCESRRQVLLEAEGVLDDAQLVKVTDDVRRSHLMASSSGPRGRRDVRETRQKEALNPLAIWQAAMVRRLLVMCHSAHVLLVFLEGCGGDADLAMIELIKAVSLLHEAACRQRIVRPVGRLPVGVVVESDGGSSDAEDGKKTRRRRKRKPVAGQTGAATVRGFPHVVFIRNKLALGRITPGWYMEEQLKLTGVLRHDPKMVCVKAVGSRLVQALCVDLRAARALKKATGTGLGHVLLRDRVHLALLARFGKALDGKRKGMFDSECEQLASGLEQLATWNVKGAVGGKDKQKRPDKGSSRNALTLIEWLEFVSDSWRRICGSHIVTDFCFPQDSGPC